jgi:hypothetical protein
MPNGKMYHKSCIYHHDSDFKIDNISVDIQTLTKEKENGDLLTEELPKCEYETRQMRHSEENESFFQNPEYYSDWAVYADTTDVKNQFS